MVLKYERIESCFPQNHQEKIHERLLRDLPLKSSLLNSFFVIPFIVITAVASDNKDFAPKDRLISATIPVLALAVKLFRLWLIAACTFKQNELDQIEERERKRQMEIEAAKIKRALRTDLMLNESQFDFF